MPESTAEPHLFRWSLQAPAGISHSYLHPPSPAFGWQFPPHLGLNVLRINLSRGGAFLGSEKLLPAGSRPAVYLSDEGANDGAIVEVEAQLTWCAEREVPDAGLPPRMGIQFLHPDPKTQARMDTLMLTSIERQLFHLW